MMRFWTALAVINWNGNLLCGLTGCVQGSCRGYKAKVIWKKRALGNLRAGFCLWREILITRIVSLALCH